MKLKKMNSFKKEIQKSDDPYKWLDINHKRRNISDRKILENVEKSCLTDTEKKTCLTCYINIEMHLV